jgi:hypothetical protein
LNLPYAPFRQYKQNLDIQGQAEAYLQAYAALVSDRREALTAERTTLAIVNTKVTKARKTMAAQLASEGIVNDKEAATIDNADDLDLNNDVLKYELDEKRKSLSERFGGRAVKTFIGELNGVLGKFLQWVGGRLQLPYLLSSSNPQRTRSRKADSQRSCSESSTARFNPEYGSLFFSFFGDFALT